MMVVNIAYEAERREESLVEEAGLCVNREKKASIPAVPSPGLSPTEDLN